MDYTLGIYQSIGESRGCVGRKNLCPDSNVMSGYKEFHDYLSAPTPSEASFREAVEQMKLGTRRYAKRQISWLRNKLLPAIHAANVVSQNEGEGPIVPTYLLDATGE